MEIVAVFLPAFIACRFQEKLEKTKYRGSELVKVWGLYTFFMNLLSVIVYQYILKTPNSMSENFGNNVFIIHYMILNVIGAVILPVLRAAVNPYVSLKLERKSGKDDETHEEKNTTQK